MPANSESLYLAPEHNDTSAWHLTPSYPTPETQVDIRNWLEDTGASAWANANQFVDPSTAAEILDDMALRVYEDVRGGYFPLEIAVQRQQARELGFTAFAYIERQNGERVIQAS